jgi:hypothetical protein
VRPRSAPPGCSAVEPRRVEAAKAPVAGAGAAAPDRGCCLLAPHLAPPPPPPKPRTCSTSWRWTTSTWARWRTRASTSSTAAWWVGQWGREQRALGARVPQISKGVAGRGRGGGRAPDAAPRIHARPLPQVLATPDSSSDGDYARIEGVVAHEYFHNWTGEGAGGGVLGVPLGPLQTAEAVPMPPLPRSSSRHRPSGRPLTPAACPPPIGLPLARPQATA